MAAPSGTTWGSTVGSKGRIGLYTSLSSTNTQTTLTVQIWFWSKYSVSDSNNTLYYDNLASSGKASTSKGSVSVSTTVATGSGWSTSNQKKLKTYTVTYDRKTSAQTRYLYAKLKGIDVVGDGAAMSVSKTVSIPKLASYTVSYNANGGSGAPGSQTKWYGTALTLSSTKPTRTGHTFQGWNTNASGTGTNYASGASYTGNAALTLYAVWKPYTHTVAYNANGGTGAPASQTKKYGGTIFITTSKPTRTGYTFSHWNTASDNTGTRYNSGQEYGDDRNGGTVTLYAIWTLNTWTVSYNANGGTGAPGNQTKKYGETLKLSTTIPTRSAYNFKGWATSATAATASYQAGGNYTTDANITLYAVWEIAYVKPTISNLQVSRCDGNGNPVGDDVETSSGLVSFVWTTFHNITSITVAWKSASGDISGSSSIPNVSGTSGTVSYRFGNNTLPMDQTFAVTVTVADSGGNTPKDITLDGYLFPIDMLGGGNGVSFGKPAELENVADFEFEAYFRNGVRPLILSDNADLNEVKTPNTYAGNAATTAGYLNCPITTGTSFTLEVLPAGGDGQIMQRITACSKTAPTIYVRHYYSNAWSDNWLTI